METDATSESDYDVLVATIGQRDPYGKAVGPHPSRPVALPGAPTGPLLTHQRYKPRTVWLFTTEGVRKQAQATVEAIEQELPGCTVHVETLELENPALLSEAFDAIEGALRRMPETDRKSRAVVCPSSGTPQLGQALVTVAMTLLPNATFVQALDPERIPDEEQRLRPFDPRITRIRFDIDHALASLRHFDWRVAQSVLGEVLTIHSDTVDQRRGILVAAHKLAAALASAADLDYARARDEAAPDATTALRRDLEIIKQWYGKATRADRPTLARELTAAAARFSHAETVARAVVTAISAWEVAIGGRLRQIGKLDPDGLKERDLQRLPAELRTQARLVAPGRWRLEGERVRREALIALDDVTASLARDGTLDCIGELAVVRNELVHTGKLDNEKASRRAGSALDALSGIFKAWGWDDWRNAPTAPESLRALIRKLETELGFS